VLDKNSLPDIDRAAITNAANVDHIPIACHYDADNLLTKTGELVQIIEITGYETKTSDFTTYNLRDLIRQALMSRIPNYRYAVYIHTIRSRKNLMPVGAEPFGLADQLNKKWCRKNNWDKQLVNTVYLSIVIQPEQLAKKSFLRKFSLNAVRDDSFEMMEKARLELTDTVGKILQDLDVFGARKLTVINTDSGYVSEQLFFYHHLINLHQRRTPLPVKDFSEYLSAATINYHFNTIEIIGKEDLQYAAIFSVKATSELSVEALNQLLQMGSQFIVGQVFYFVPAEEAKKKLQMQYDLLSLSKSKIALEKSGLEDFIKSDKGKCTDYCHQQTTITIHSDDVDFFLQKINMTNRILKELGLVVIREDFYMPKLFWGQLPGNFRYLKKSRLEYLNSKRIGEFCTIHHHFAGSYKGSKWGPPVSLLRSFDGTPFFFNFHTKEGNGNTVVIGPKNSGKTVFKNFFVAQAAKLNPRIIYLDFEGVAKDFVKSIGGEYYLLGQDESLPLKLNPFDGTLYNGEVELFKQWLIAAIMPAATKMEKYNEFFQVLATKLIEQPELPDKLAMIKEIVTNTGDVALIEGYDKILGSPEFNKLFSQKEEVFGLFDLHNVIGLNLTAVAKNDQLTNVFLGLLLNASLAVLDGTPTIIVFNKLNKVYEMPYFTPLFGKWLDELTKRNAMAFCSDIHAEALHKNEAFLEHYTHFGSRVFLSDKYADKYFRKAFKLNDNELYKIKSYSNELHMFLLKQDDLSIVIALQLADLKDEIKLLGKFGTGN